MAAEVPSLACKVDVSKAMQNLTMRVEVVGMSKLRTRVWLAMLCFRIGASVAGCNIEFVNDVQRG